MAFALCCCPPLAPSPFPLSACLPNRARLFFLSTQLSFESPLPTPLSPELDFSRPPNPLSAKCSSAGFFGIFFSRRTRLAFPPRCVRQCAWRVDYSLAGRDSPSSGKLKGFLALQATNRLFVASDRHQDRGRDFPPIAFLSPVVLLRQNPAGVSTQIDGIVFFSPFKEKFRSSRLFESRQLLPSRTNLSYFFTLFKSYYRRDTSEVGRVPCLAAPGPPLPLSTSVFARYPGRPPHS